MQILSFEKNSFRLYTFPYHVVKYVCYKRHINAQWSLQISCCNVAISHVFRKIHVYALTIFTTHGYGFYIGIISLLPLTCLCWYIHKLKNINPNSDWEIFKFSKDIHHMIFVFMRMLVHIPNTTMVLLTQTHVFALNMFML